MPFRLPVFRFSLRVHHLFALAAGLGLVMGAYASGGHDSGSSHAASATVTATATAPASEAEDRPKVIGKGELKRKAAAAKAAQPEAPAESSASGPSSVSMSDLRELIDQKIAEVRAKQAAAPAVKVVAKSPRKPRAAGASASAANHDAHGALLPKEDGHGHDLHWQYGGTTGPQSWGQLKPEFQSCMLGKRQSPIDIRDGIKVQLEPIQFEYRPTAFRVIDNGHTVQVNLDPGNFITVTGRRYELLQFHFHRPSEERINGRQFDLVAHLVHKDAEGRLAVVAVLMDQGKDNPMVQLVWNSLPLEKGIEQAAPVLLDMNLMLPETRLYYTYMGSLTTPPCSEGVLWMVMKHPASLSRDQLAIFSRLYSNNARPVQPLGDRLIKEGM
ncbi:MAG: carbonic anhydrase family protein [Pseudomonadota bacterium]